MCHSVLISTTSEQDFGNVEFQGFSLSPISEQEKSLAQVLKHPQQWYVHSAYGGCSCHFRHSQEDLEHPASLPSRSTFSTPEEEAIKFGGESEDDDDVEHTRLFFDFLQSLLASGEQVDLVNWWNQVDPSLYREREVNLAEVGRERFRFFENTRFVLS